MILHESKYVQVLTSPKKIDRPIASEDFLPCWSHFNSKQVRTNWILMAQISRGLKQKEISGPKTETQHTKSQKMCKHIDSNDLLVFFLWNKKLHHQSPLLPSFFLHCHPTFQLCVAVVDVHVFLRQSASILSRMIRWFSSPKHPQGTATLLKLQQLPPVCPGYAEAGFPTLNLINSVIWKQAYRITSAALKIRQLHSIRLPEFYTQTDALDTQGSWNSFLNAIEVGCRDARIRTLIFSSHIL